MTNTLLQFVERTLGMTLYAVHKENMGNWRHHVIFKICCHEPSCEEDIMNLLKKILSTENQIKTVVFALNEEEDDLETAIYLDVDETNEVNEINEKISMMSANLYNYMEANTWVPESHPQYNKMKEENSKLYEETRRQLVELGKETIPLISGLTFLRNRRKAFENFVLHVFGTERKAFLFLMFFGTKSKESLLNFIGQTEEKMKEHPEYNRESPYKTAVENFQRAKSMF